MKFKTKYNIYYYAFKTLTSIFFWFPVLEIGAYYLAKKLGHHGPAEFALAIMLLTVAVLIITAVSQMVKSDYDDFDLFSCHLLAYSLAMPMIKRDIGEGVKITIVFSPHKEKHILARAYKKGQIFSDEFKFKKDEMGAMEDLIFDKIIPAVQKRLGIIKKEDEEKRQDDMINESMSRELKSIA